MVCVWRLERRVFTIPCLWLQKSKQAAKASHNQHHPPQSSRPQIRLPQKVQKIPLHQSQQNHHKQHQPQRMVLKRLLQHSTLLQMRHSRNNLSPNKPNQKKRLCQNQILSQKKLQLQTRNQLCTKGQQR